MFVIYLAWMSAIDLSMVSSLVIIFVVVIEWGCVNHADMGFSMRLQMMKVKEFVKRRNKSEPHVPSIKVDA